MIILKGNGLCPWTEEVMRISYLRPLPKNPLQKELNQFLQKHETVAEQFEDKG